MGERDMGNGDRKLWQSQNFLKSSEYVSGLIDRAGIGIRDVVIEIGAGKGVITEQLAKRAARVVAIEIDRNLVGGLRQRLSGSRNVEVLQADFFRWDLPRYPYKIFANIPFNMTSDMLNKLLFADNPPQAAFLIMQDKAAGRFIGPPYGPMSQMSTLLQPFFEMGVLERIDRKKFYPEPSVNAVLARFEKRQRPMVDLSQRSFYNDFVVYGFNQWKPTFLDAMREIFTDKQLNILSRNYNLKGIKPSELSVNQWVSAFETFLKYVPADRQSEVKGAEKRLKSKQKFMSKWHRTR